MKNLITSLILLFTITQLSAQDALNLTLFGNVQTDDVRYSGSWSYIAPDGSEYALLGAKTATVAYNIDDAANIVELGSVPGPSSNWREITVIGDHAYVTTEGGAVGMQVIYLGDLPNGIELVTTFDSTFATGHILQRDIYSEEPYVYVNGTSSTAGIHIIDVSDPANPVEVGVYDPDYYIHDCHVKGDRIYACAFYVNQIDVIDISDKTNPTLISTIPDPGGNTHSAWTSEDDQYLFVCDELDGLPMRVFDISDLDNVSDVAVWSANLLSLTHNPYVRDEFCFVAHNTEGLRVLDVVDPTLPVEVAYYDTYDGPSGGFSGLWSACPYFPSGKIIGGNRTDGLYIWEFNNTKAVRIYGSVVDSITGMELINADLVLNETSETMQSDIFGLFKFGGLAGTYSVSASFAGYTDKTIGNIVLDEDNASATIVFELVPEDFIAVPFVNVEVPNLNAFPNPTNDLTNIDLTGFEKVTTIVLRDVQGKLIRKIDTNGQDLIQLSIADLDAGTYFFQVVDGVGQALGQGRIAKMK